MFPFMLGLLLVHLFQPNNCVSVKTLEPGATGNENVVEETQEMKEKINEMVRAANEDLVRKMASLEEVLESRNVKEEQLLTRIEELEARVGEGTNSRSVSKYKAYVNNDVKTLCEAEVNKKLVREILTTFTN